jgi:hypothetical protein
VVAKRPARGYVGEAALLPTAPYGFGQATTPAAIQAQMLQRGNDAVGTVLIEQPGGITHAPSVVNRGGQVFFIDGQSGLIVTIQPTAVVKLGLP